jgi:hypothetical protein
VTSNFVIDALAVYRLTRLVTRDTITDDLRETVQGEIQTAATAGIITQKTSDRFAYLIECDWCMSIWVAAVAYSLKKYVPHVWGTISHILAASAVAGALANQE